MGGPSSPGTEGPTVAPPHLPSGWIAQWDGESRKYYYVELSTGRSQWDVPTRPAPTAGGTPNNAGVDHPYGVPGGDRRIITHPDGSQTIQHPDGRMEPILPAGVGGGGGARGMDGPSGDRGLGSFAQSALSSIAGGKNHGGSPNPLGSLASSLLGGGSSSQGPGHGGGGGGGGVSGGKIVSQLASSIFSSSGEKPSGPTNYHGGQTQGQHHGTSGGLAGHVMGNVASMFGGSNKPSHNYGYSNPGYNGPYSGPEPPISYQPPWASGSSKPAQQQQPQAQHQQQQTQHHQQSYNPPPQYNQSQSHQSSYGGGHFGSNPKY